MFGLGFGELILIFLIALIFIGPKKLPELAKGLGKGLREFQNAAKGFTDQLNEEQQTPPEKIADATQQQTETTETAPTKTDDTKTHS
jgi:sec-independent protein translocase protein TatA